MTSPNRILPSDPTAEDCLIGAILLDPSMIVPAMEIVSPEDFYILRNSRVFQAAMALFESGGNIDAVTISSYLGDPSLVAELAPVLLNVPSSQAAPDYAAVVAGHAKSRRLIVQMQDAVNCLFAGDDAAAQAERIEGVLAGLGSSKVSAPESQTIEELIEDVENAAPVVIEGLMNRDFRTIIVGSEGSGKSTILRAIGMQAAQGIHPFSHRPLPDGPVRVLVVDLENPRVAVLQTAQVLRETLMDTVLDDYDPDRFRIWRKPGGIDIRKRLDRAELEREIAFQRPELVCAGPVYKSYQRNSNESYEDSADEAMAVWDRLRIKYGFALVLEHHAAKGGQGQKREMTPMGSQRWMAWPEIGISLYKDENDPTVSHVKRYRGDRLAGVNWPDKIIHNREFLVNGIWDSGVPGAQGHYLD